MVKVNCRKYVYKNPERRVINSDLNNGLNCQDDCLISDSEALLKANSLTVEDQHHGFKLNTSFTKKESANRKISIKAQPAKISQKQKESRVPGLFGCNRYKSKRTEQVKESEMFCFF
ncbi:hypothetical protein DA098_02880 [Vibrio parahaemolyticus]|nr:hypothetical protein DA098_02880 [Vibrio parahaemolyticus]TMX78633.1 hypothetical protein DA094_09910 [Vibrio parahaemolyticus]